MLTIFMTGDNHIGLKYASHENSDILRENRIVAFENMVQAANKENCELFVITGDLFENTSGVSKKDTKRILDILSDFNGTIVVLPGNHDYYDDEVKVWRTFKELLINYDNIMLLSEYRPYKLTVDDGEVILYPALCKSLHSLPWQNNLGWIKEENIEPDSTYRIGIAHGAIQGETIDNEGQYFLMKPSELESIPLDVWLIGHTHVQYPRNLTEKFEVCNNIFNAGTHVQTDVSCNTEGACFVIQIDSNKTVRAKKFVSGNLHFCRKHIDVTAGKMREIIASELNNIPDNSVVDLIVTGAITIDEYEDKDSIFNTTLSRFLEGTYNDYALSKLISKDLIESEFSETSLSAKLLNELLENPKEAQLAYELLNSLKERN